MRISTSSSMSRSDAVSSAEGRSSGTGHLLKRGSMSNVRCDKKRHLEIDEDALSEVCSENDGREASAAQKIPPNSSMKLEKKLQDYVAEEAKQDSSPSSVSSNVFASGKTFWMKFLDDTQSQVSEDTEGQRRGTPVGREIRHTWSSGSPLSECSAFNDAEDGSPKPLMNKSKPTESTNSSLRQGGDLESRSEQACRNDENSGHRRSSTGGPRDQPSPLLISRRSVLTPESTRMTPTGRYFGDVTNRIDHSSPSPAPNSQSKAKSKVAELTEKFQKESIGSKTMATPPAQVLMPSGAIGSNTKSSALRVMTSCTPIPNNSNVRLAESPPPDPVIEMGGILHTPTSQASITSEAYATPQSSQLGKSKQGYDPSGQERLPDEYRNSKSGVQAIISVFSGSVPTSTQLQHVDQEPNTSDEHALFTPPPQVAPLDGIVEAKPPTPNLTGSKQMTAIEVAAETTKTDPAHQSAVPKHVLVNANDNGGKCEEETKAESQALVRSDNSGFRQLLRQWRDKSDDKPNAHFLSPEQESRPETRRTNASFSPQVTRLQLEDGREQSAEQELRSETRKTNASFSPQVTPLQLEDGCDRSISQGQTPLVAKRIRTYNKDYFDVVRENLEAENQEPKPFGELRSSLQTSSKNQRCDDADSPPQVPKVNAFYENSQLVCQPVPSTSPERALSTDETSQAIVILKSRDSVKVLFGEAQKDDAEQVVVRNVEMITSSEQETYASADGPCECSSSVFSGNDDLISFFLPKMGMACTCGRENRQFVHAEDPTAIENILRPWQVEFLKSFGIHRGDQLVKARHRSAGLLAKALRQWRKKKGMVPFKTSACGMAIHIWAKTCKAFVRSIRKHTTTGTLMLDQQPAELAQEFSNFLGALPGAPGRQGEHHMLAIEPDSQVEV
mmetsp:Transcript_50246/g.76476  ORF Transcript_50246/g.76476 Transcript_50246/m.76476 type:complete len:900 (+) Transcript_50246:137-2836(+)